MLESSGILIRQRFTECLSMLNYIERLIPPDQAGELRGVTDEVKALRGLWLVSLYGAFEKSINTIFSEVLEIVESSEVTLDKLKPSLKSVFNYPHIQSIKDCGYDTVVERSIEFLKISDSNSKVVLTTNPLINYLQNVDGKSVIFLCSVLSIDEYTIDNGVIGRLGNLKERRNAVAHGRETPAEVGGRFNTAGLQSLHTLVQEETSRFHLTCEDYCANELFNR